MMMEGSVRIWSGSGTLELTKRPVFENNGYSIAKIFAGSYIIMHVDLKTSSLEGLTDIYQRDKDIIQQNIFNKTEESLGKSHLP
jgi:hypothetical protein